MTSGLYVSAMRPPFSSIEGLKAPASLPLKYDPRVTVALLFSLQVTTGSGCSNP